MEFFYGEQLRWNWGLENPNKAGALIGSLIPILWIGWEMSWRVRARVLRGLLVVAAGGLVAAGWWALFTTGSRGGVVAALAGCAYAAWRGRRFSWVRVAGAALLVVVVSALAVATQAADRTFTSTADKSVENRVTLWSGALRMLAENPQGVGRGMSGEAYMQWYQALEAAARYRTLVNSYLTFTVERGLAVAGLAAFGALLVWGMTARAGGAGGGVAAGLRGALVAFAVAGVFSTTMEEWRLWVAPGLCVAGLAGMAARGWSEIPARRAFFTAAVGAFAICGVVWGAGAVLAWRSPLKIHIAQMQPPSVVVTPPGGTREMTVLPDDAVLGRDYGKLLRRLALGTDAMLRVVPSPDAGTWPLMAAGGRVEDVDPAAGRELILVAPATVTEERRAGILKSTGPVLILLPAFDEDGRVDFWERNAEEAHVVPLAGVGNQVNWAWDAVIEAILTRRSAPPR